MSRLIDADELKKIIDEKEKWILELIDEQPTAYDVEKTVDNLRDNKDWSLSSSASPRIRLDDAIRIVREGGIE